MNEQTAPTSGITVLLSVLGWITAIVSAVYAGYLAMVVASSSEAQSWTLPVWVVSFGMLFVAISKIIEKLSGIEHLLLKQSLARDAAEHTKP